MALSNDPSVITREMIQNFVAGGLRVGNWFDALTMAPVAGPYCPLPRNDNPPTFTVISITGSTMKIGKDKLKMSSGEVRKFGSQKKRDNFERVAQAVKHGWKKPKGKGKK